MSGIQWGIHEKYCKIQNFNKICAVKIKIVMTVLGELQRHYVYKNILVKRYNVRHLTQPSDDPIYNNNINNSSARIRP